jgi:hypothetical protein
MALRRSKFAFILSTAAPYSRLAEVFFDCKWGAHLYKKVLKNKIKGKIKVVTLCDDSY